MNTVFKTFLSMSFSGGLLILLLFLGTRFWKNRLSRQWQYYIWLTVILRLLLPFGPERTLLGKTYQAVDQALTQTVQTVSGPESGSVPAVEGPQNELRRPAEEPSHPLRDIGTLLDGCAWIIWSAGALGLLIRKITVYQGFLRYVKAGAVPVSDIALLDRVSAAAEQAGVRKPVELCVNPLISSPLLLGFFQPCIVLPGTDVSETDLPYIALHELTHYKRRDMLYKWLVQVTVCLHWFNPLAHLMSREITRACEFSCDEAVLSKMGCGHAQDYGRTLLNAMAAVGRYKADPGAVTLSENKQLLKERLGAIMNFKRKSAAIRLLTCALTLCAVLGAAFVGLYPAAAADRMPERPAASPLPGKTDEPSEQEDSGVSDNRYSLMAETYYKAGSLPLFQMVFVRLDEESQLEWLDRIYSDNQIAFWGAALNLLEEDCSLIQRYAEIVYNDGSIVYFSVLAMHMSEDTLEKWLDRAVEDGNWAFQSVLFNALDQNDEFGELEEKQNQAWAAAQMAEYEAVGVTVDGRDYYYQGQLVNIFLDIRQSDQSFCTLNMNPKGTVNLKIVRDKNDEITGVEYMTDAEAAALLEEPFGDISDEPDDDFDGWLDEAQKAEYKAAGITVDGKNCYYQGQLARIFLDRRSNHYYTLNRNPLGTVDIKIVRGENNRITGVEYLTEEEVSELFGDMDDPETVPVDLETVAAGESVLLGAYTLSDGDRIWYDISAETGSRMHVFFAKDEQTDAVYWSVNNRRQKDEPLRCCADFTVGPPASAPGTYRLYLRAPDDALENVKGSVSIG